MLNKANVNFVYFSIHITIRKCIFTEIFKRFREWHDNILVTALISMPIIVFVLFFILYHASILFIENARVICCVKRSDTNETYPLIWHAFWLFRA